MKAVGKARAIQPISAPTSQLLISSSGKLTSEVKVTGHDNFCGGLIKLIPSLCTKHEQGGGSH